jgi:hypothetical protein
VVKRRVGAGAFLSAMTVFAAPAGAAVPHVVAPGETLSGIAAVNGMSAESVAAFNGIASDAYVIESQTIQIPAVGEVPATTTPTAATTAATEPVAEEPTAESIAPAPGMGHVDSPWGQLHLDPAAAESWNAMAAAAMEQFGVAIHPGGPLSAYRSYEQQAYLYDEFLAGTGAPANPPGSSTHEVGVAVDVATPEMRSVIDQIGGAYGWSATIPSEWWHVSWGGY